MTPQPQQEYVCNSCEYRCVVKTPCKTPPFVGCIFNSDIGAILSSRPAPAPEQAEKFVTDAITFACEKHDAQVEKKERERVLGELSIFHSDNWCEIGLEERTAWYKKIESLRGEP